VRDMSSVNLAKLFATFAIWLAYAGALGLRLRGILLAKRFSWACLALFVAALLSLGPVDRSRHPVERTEVRAR
jgi:HemX protein